MLKKGGMNVEKGRGRLLSRRGKNVEGGKGKLYRERWEKQIKTRREGGKMGWRNVREKERETGGGK